MNASIPQPSQHPAGAADLAFLKAVLGFDAVTCVLLGTVLLLGNAAAARFTGLPAPLLAEADAVLLAFGAFVGWAAVRKAASRLVLLCIVYANVLWCVASVALALFFAQQATQLGRTLVLVQGIAVGALALVEFIAWKRATT